MQNKVLIKGNNSKQYSARKPLKINEILIISLIKKGEN